MRYTPLVSLLAATLVALGCAGDELAGPEQALPPSLDVHNGTTVVSTEAALRAALAAASPGDVIEIDGLIEVDETVFVLTDGVTLKGTSEGSGLVGSDAFTGLGVLLAVNFTEGAVVKELVLDGGNAVSIAPLSPLLSNGVRFVENTVICRATPICVFVLGGNEVEIVENRIVAGGGTVTGIFLRAAGEGALVRENEVVATEPLALDQFAGIELFATENAEVEENEVVGPWPIGVGMLRVASSLVAENHVSGAESVGILVRDDAEGPPVGPNSADNLFKENEVEGSGDLSCQDATSGSGTAGTTNTWEDNEGEAPSDPAGLCA